MSKRHRRQPGERCGNCTSFTPQVGSTSEDPVGVCELMPMVGGIVFQGMIEELAMNPQGEMVKVPKALNISASFPWKQKSSNWCQHHDLEEIGTKSEVVPS